MSALRLLALSYLASASVFVVTATLVARPELRRELVAGGNAMVAAVTEHLRPAPAEEPVVRLTLAPPGPNDARTLAHAHVSPRETHTVQAPDRLSHPDISAQNIIPILPDLSPEAAPVPAEPKLIKPNPVQPPDIKSDARIAQAPVIPVPSPAAPAQTRVAVAMARLKERLTPDMIGNFGLILYVSKAKTGPVAQHMLVVENKAGALKPIHDWAASTGREQDEISPRGRSSFTATPAGFYELDPTRIYLRYHSWSWDQDMPHAMFFNWERRGMATGLAIHAATGGDIAKLASRASAGCVHLAPQNAATLYKLIRHDYRGPVPRFAYNAATQTMSNSGNFMHDRNGSLKMVDGYKVLVVIDDYGGETRVAALD